MTYNVFSGTLNPTQSMAVKDQLKTLKSYPSSSVSDTAQCSALNAKTEE